MLIVLLLVCIVASLIGSISGIGGGIIIKPLVDSLNFMSLETLNFLSGTTVLSMSIATLFRNKNEIANINTKLPLYLGMGSIIGGFYGKSMFNTFIDKFPISYVNIIQYVSLIIINIFILVYLLNKHKLKTKTVTSKSISIIFGIILGIISSFLGIGGGPLNIAILYYFYSLDAKQTTILSLFTIFLSQGTSTISTIITGIPKFNFLALIVMCFGGVTGALIGSMISKKMDNNKVQKFFMVVIVLLIALNVFNLVKV